MKKRDLIIKIILVIIIIVLIIHNCCLIKENKQTGINNPTGNVDVFEIWCNSDSCDIKNEDKKEEETETTISTNANNYNDSNKTENEGNLVIEDKTKKWKSINTLNIFSNPAYDFEQKIAPESSNGYEFLVKNNTKYNVVYSIKFIEKNEYNINLKYRLKKGTEYIVGNEETWVSYSELNQINKKLKINNVDEYYLEWKWVSSNNDTSVAGIEDAYKLSIQIEAESSNE